MNKKIPIQLAVGIIIIIALIVGVTFLIGNKTEQTTPPNTTLVPLDRDTPSSPPVNKTANWQIYKNEKYKFEIKYSEEWTPGDLYSAQTGPNAKAPRVIFIEKKNMNKETELPNISITIHKNESELNLENWWFEHIKDFGAKDDLIAETKRQELILNDDVAYRVSTTKAYPSIPSDSIYITHDNMVYEITTTFESNLLGDNIYSKMVETFKFTE